MSIPDKGRCPLLHRGPVLFFLFVLALVLHENPARAEIPVPPPRGYVNDLAGVIPPQLEQRISAVIQTLEQNTGAEIAVLTVPSTEGEPIFDFAMRVAEEWKPGKKGKDNGLVFVVAVEDRRMFIATGYGLEGILPDGKVGGIEDEFIVPYFKENRFGEGVLSGVIALASAIDPAHADEYKAQGAGGLRLPPPPRPRPSPKPGLFQVIFLLLGLVFMIYLAIRHPGLFLLLMFMGGGPRRGGFGGGGFGGGFGGFGGGGFGGGGAGRGF